MGVKTTAGLALLPCLLALSVRIVSVSTAHSEDRWRVGQTDALAETVFRDQMAEHPGYTHYLSILNNNPSPAFMKRFTNIAVRPALRFNGRSKNAHVHASLSDSYSIDRIRWISHTRADVDASAVQIGGRAGGFGVYRLVLTRDRWRVAAYTSKGIF